MNFRAFFAVAVVAAAATFAPAEATTFSTTACTGTQTNAAYVSLVAILLDLDLTTCSSDSTYNLLYATAVPSAAQYKLMCASTACENLLTAVLSLSAQDCVLTIPTSGLAINILELASDFNSTCSAL